MNSIKSIRHFSRNTYLSIFGSFKKPNKGVYILNSHNVSIYNRSKELFNEFLTFLNKYCELISIVDAVELIKHKQIGNNCQIAFTFDDGYKDCYEVFAPALESFKVNAAFFINGGFVNSIPNLPEAVAFAENNLKSTFREPMSWDEIIELSNRGHIIGSHTLDHIDMNTNNLEVIDFQLRKNKELIEHYTNKPCEYFAIPFGQLKHINEKTLELAEKYHKYIFSGTDHKNYFSFNGRVLNRRHIEIFWPISHIRYFLSNKRKY